jgi:fatty acid desaturase
VEETATPALTPAAILRLQDSAGRTGREVVAGLTPRYGLAWLHIACGYAAIAVTVALVAVAASERPLGFVLGGALGGIALGFWFHFVYLFEHEAAHYNLAGSRRTNDRLANAFIGSLIGEDIRRYRPVHLAHHKWLGTTMDTERSYFDPLDLRFLVESLTGVRAARVFLQRDQLSRRADSSEAEVVGVKEQSGPGYLNGTLVRAAALNGVIVIGALVVGEPVVAAAWVLGFMVFLPACNSLRQVLEHRDAAADPTVDYRVVPHGAVNRLFGPGPLGRTLGGAGFNRHLLHHWMPQVSYTRLGELEAFLRDTELAPVLAGHSTTYGRALVRIAG